MKWEFVYIQSVNSILLKNKIYLKNKFNKKTTNKKIWSTQLNKKW
jgi:hypothetical protein